MSEAPLSSTQTPKPPPVITEGEPAEPRTARWWFVHISVVASFALFFLFVALLYWNWLRVQEPTASLRITGGSPAYEGAIVRVEGGYLNKPLELPLSAQTHYGGRIYLRPGVYMVSVLKDGKTLLAGEAPILESRESTLELPRRETPASAEASPSES